MADRLPPPTAEQLGWLSVAPPLDEHQQAIAWTLSDCHIEEAKWSAAIVHQGLTLERVELVAVQWQRPVFRNCVLREVSFTRSNFVQARFESVTFERCSFERSAFEQCEFDHCRFVDCQLDNHIAFTTAFRLCEFERLALAVLDMREGELSGSVLRDSSLQGPRLSQVHAERLTIAGGELQGGDWTACEFGQLRLEGLSIEGLRILDGELAELALLDARVEGLAIGGAKLGRLSFARCAELPGVRILDCRVGELVFDQCASVASPVLADSELGTLTVHASVLYDGAFERLAVTRARIEHAELTGVFFQAGAWQQLELVDAAVRDYVAVKDTHFEQLRFERTLLDASLDRRLEGDQYGAGSMTWGGAGGP